MKPVLAFRFARTEGPGHFATFLAEHGIAWKLVALDEGDPVPESSRYFAGLGFMGGPMSANDELPWTQPVLTLMRDAAARGVPVIGHCLGGQMLARALGARVTRHDRKEIGWVPLEVERNATGFLLRGHACPLATAVRAEPHVCSALEELVAGVTGAPVRECCERDPATGTTKCRFEVQRGA